MESSFSFHDDGGSDIGKFEPPSPETCLKEPLALYKFCMSRTAPEESAGCPKTWAAGRLQALPINARSEVLERCRRDWDGRIERPAGK